MRLEKLTYLLLNSRLLPRFFLDYRRFRIGLTGWDCKFSDLLPILTDKSIVMEYDSHYVYHTAWAARVLKELSPEEHVDISSSLMFCAIASAFLKIRHYDYRDPQIRLSGLTSGSKDLLKLGFEDNSIKSLSCMHVIEHVGLGRYGDEINPQGDVLAANELQRVLAPGGSLLIVVPLAEKARIRFNGHRIYDLDKVASLFKNLELSEFSFLNDRIPAKFSRNANILDLRGSVYGCGCFVFRKSRV